MVSHPELGSDQPIGSDRESGRDTLEGHFCPKLMFLKVMKIRGYFCK